jgi:hypothetical protein
LFLSKVMGQREYISTGQSTLIQVNQIDVESQNNVLHIKSHFQSIPH